MYRKWLLILMIPCFLFSCVLDVPQQGGGSDSTETGTHGGTASVSFLNETSYRVELYKNTNPTIHDKNTQPVVVLSSGETKTVQLPSSAEQTIGDTFYIHYAAMLDNGETNGGTPVYAKAQRDIWNLTFVIKGGQTYSKKITQPPRDELVFSKVYVKLKNESSTDIQLGLGSSILRNLGTQTVNIKSGTVGVYELDVPDMEDKLTVSNLRVYIMASDKYVPISPFTIKQGFLAVFTYRSSGAIKAPDISSLVK